VQGLDGEAHNQTRTRSCRERLASENCGSQVEESRKGFFFLYSSIIVLKLKGPQNKEDSRMSEGEEEARTYQELLSQLDQEQGVRFS